MNSAVMQKREKKEKEVEKVNIEQKNEDTFVVKIGDAPQKSNKKKKKKKVEIKSE